MSPSSTCALGLREQEKEEGVEVERSGGTEITILIVVLALWLYSIYRSQQSNVSG